METVVLNKGKVNKVEYWFTKSVGEVYFCLFRRKVYQVSLGK